MYPSWSWEGNAAGGIVAAMVTRIRGTRPVKLFLAEHRKAKGVSPEAMAGRLGITRESVHRIERETHRLNPQKQADYAAALDIDPERLWHPPEEPSADAELKNTTLDVRRAAVEMVRIFISSRR